MNFEVGKKYHNPGSKVYRELVCINEIDGLKYYTFTWRNKSNDKINVVNTVYQPHRNLIPYLKTREVTHERWVYWIKNRSHGEIRLWTSTIEVYKREYERNNPNWTFLSCEKITYTETIEE